MTGKPDLLALVGLRMSQEEAKKDAFLLSLIELALTCNAELEVARAGGEEELRRYLKRYAEDRATLHDYIAKIEPKTDAGLIAKAKFVMEGHWNDEPPFIYAGAFAVIRSFLAREGCRA